MNDRFQLPDKLPLYIKRLIVEYQNNDMAFFAPVLSHSKHEVNLETEYDWRGEHIGHDVIFFVPDELMGLIPLDSQNEIRARVAQDLNKASSSVASEFISSVHFEYSEEVHSSENEITPDIKSINRLWQPNAIKLFVSHRDTSKKYAHELAKHLCRYGISSFVAHDSIEPDEEWQKEIEKALQSMDVMLVFITDDFFDSAWTNQEIGFALGRGVPIISIKLEKCDPIGFIKDRQAIVGKLEEVCKSSKSIWETIKKRLAHSDVFRGVVISRFVQAGSYSDAGQAAQELCQLENLRLEDIQKIVNGFNSNSQLHDCWNLNRNSKLINFLNKYSSNKLTMKNNKILEVEHENQDIPF